MIRTHLTCPNCGGEFDFEEMSHFRPMGNYATAIYDGHKLATYVTGFFDTRAFNCPHCGKLSKFNVKSNPSI
ncbi:MAG: hypothetical protein ABSA75_06795 [Candidatus Bathyarchaeia archaeon]